MLHFCAHEFVGSNVQLLILDVKYCDQSFIEIFRVLKHFTMDNHSQYFSIEETFGYLYFKLSFCCKSLVLLFSKSLLIITGMCKNKDEVPFKLTTNHTLYI